MSYNKRVEELFNEIADIIEIEDDKRIFEIRAYRKAAVNIGELQEDVAEIIKKKGMEGLKEIPGIGEGLAKKIEELVRTGRMKKYDELKKKYPIDFTNLTRIQSLGSRKAFKLYKALRIRNVEDLKKAVEAHKIRDLEGFGEDSEAKLAKGLEQLASTKGRILLGKALPEAESIVRKLITSKLVDKVEIAGSIRRMRETVGDIDILATSSKPEKVMDAFSKLDEVESVIGKGPTKSTVMLKIGITCDLRVVERKSFGAAMQYFIGGKDHNVKVRQIAIKKGYKLNEYGLFDRKDRIVESLDESEIYKALGMEWPEPEMRENRGEVELALSHKLPKLVQLKGMKGDLHTHTTNSDGGNTVEEMARKAMELGYEYIGITDHSKSEYIAHGMDEKRFLKYSKEIDAANKKLGDKIRILKSAETDILKDGTLDFSKEALKEMDYVLASIHTSLTMSREEMTKRVVKAMESGQVDIFGHPTDRLIQQRDPINMDLDRVFQAAKDNGVVMEVDGFPERLDLNDENIFKAREYGLSFAIDTDAHRTGHMELMRYGIGMAKRGWLRKEDVINTQSIDKLLKFFSK